MPRTYQQELGAAESLLTAWGGQPPERRVDYRFTPGGEATTDIAAPWKLNTPYRTMRWQNLPREYFKEYKTVDPVGEFFSLFSGGGGGKEWVERPGRREYYETAIQDPSQGFGIGRDIGNERRGWLQQAMNSFKESHGRWPTRWETRQMEKQPDLGRMNFLSKAQFGQFETAKTAYEADIQALPSNLAWDNLAGSLVGRMGALRRENPRWEPGPGYRSVQQDIIQRERS